MRLQLPVLVALMVAAVALAIAAKRVRMPYNVALVIGGMLIAVGEVLPAVPRMDPLIVLSLAVPALLYEAGITADLAGVRANAPPIAILATLGLLMGTAVTGAVAHYSLALPIATALLLGVILSNTDTVSILYVFRRVPVPKRLAGIMQGETLFNDGTTLVIYAALASVVAGRTVSLPGLGAQMAITTLGGLAVGLALGLTASFVIRRTQDPLAEVMVTSALAFASFTAATELGVSGAIAAVTAGLTTAATLRQTVGPQSQVAIHTFWEYVAFGVNTFLFLLVGLSTRPASLLEHYPEILTALGAMFAGRATAIYSLFALLRLWRPAQAAPPRWQHVFVIGSFKGALSIAMALGLPVATPQRELLIDVVFGATFISLVVQVPLLIGAIRRLGLVQREPAAEAIGEQQALLIAARAARQELDGLHAAGLVPRDGYEHLRGEYQVAIAGAERELRRLHERHLAFGARLLLSTRRRLIDAERTAVLTARRAGLIPDDSAEQVVARIDARMLELERVLSENHRARREGTS